MASKTPEGEVQAYGAEQLKKHGCLVRKISYEGRRGATDYLVLVPKRDLLEWPRPDLAIATFWGPKTLFLEFKKDENAPPDPHQEREHRRMRKRGADVRTIGSKEQVDALIKELFPS